MDGCGKISVDGTVTSSNHRSFTELIHDDVELGIHGVSHREEELTVLTGGFRGRDDSF
ncbi:hypothetical protein F2Q69_00036933 [Brassica cretica]|uniref:Uncharacterized protein n=1 Tax=Brassica cretica TaxID=69181 RepID=A0A8S9SJD8_BRACR|nr:hypothetical protein F2Q69_00036933 [Brassica cretica]